jgi:hypothetical protein
MQYQFTGNILTVGVQAMRERQQAEEEEKRREAEMRIGESLEQWTKEPTDGQRNERKALFIPCTLSPPPLTPSALQRRSGGSWRSRPGRRSGCWPRPGGGAGSRGQGQVTNGSGYG